MLKQAEAEKGAEKADQVTEASDQPQETISEEAEEPSLNTEDLEEDGSAAPDESVDPEPKFEDDVSSFPNN